MDPMTEAIPTPDDGRAISFLLQEHPDDSFLSPTNDAGERWLDELLLRSELPPMSALLSWVGGYALHPTHWIIFGVQRSCLMSATHFVYCYPKSGYAAAQLREAFVTDAKKAPAAQFNAN